MLAQSHMLLAQSQMLRIYKYTIPKYIHFTMHQASTYLHCCQLSIAVFVPKNYLKSYKQGTSSNIHTIMNIYSSLYIQFQFLHSHIILCVQTIFFFFFSYLIFYQSKIPFDSLLIENYSLAFRDSANYYILEIICHNYCTVLRKT